jgi:hypothetical protein
VKGEPTIDAVAFVLPGKPGSDALLVAMRDGSVIERVNDGESFVADANCEFPPDGAGFWLWRDTGSAIVPPDQYNEDGGVAWDGRWVRPSLFVGFSLVAGRMPWDEAPVRSLIEVERDELVDRVATLEAEVDDLRCDIQGAQPMIPDLPPGYDVVESTDDDDEYPWFIKRDGEWLDMDYLVDNGTPPATREATSELCWSHWATYHAGSEWADFIAALR